METLNNMASAAAQAVWPSSQKGAAEVDSTDTTTASNSTYNDPSSSTTDAQAPDSTSEPLSGVLGDASKGEPYDAGNAVEQDAANKRYSASDLPATNAGADTAVDGSDNALQTQKTETAEKSSNPLATSESAGLAGMKGSKVPSGGSADSGVADRGLDGPGPRPITQVAAEHKGDAGQAQIGTTSGSGAGDAADDEEDKPQSASHGTGTGEKYVRSSGLKADGGDFDAAREGAGREADRILEAKGISHGVKEQPSASAIDDTPTSDSGSASPGKKEKVSLGEKIKNKLRRSS
ncbi:hypothetical protein SEPCBS57363_000299 [Sporothrix epigloea]|uniref:Glycine-rich cell wall structural protein 1 n=1 Tax=Sporothrix epigloea TaxID=1892477 RepID=A0ABP0D6P5_9PEZI